MKPVIWIFAGWLTSGISHGAEFGPIVPDGLMMPKDGTWEIRPIAAFPKSHPVRASPLPKADLHFNTKPNDPIFVRHGEVEDLDIYRKAAQLPQTVLSNSALVPVALKGTLFEPFTLLGYVASGTRPKGPWTAITRVFAKPPGELVTLAEWDFGLDGGSVLFVQEMMNTKVAGIPATVIVTKDKSATGTQVVWVSGTRKFELNVVCKLRTCTGPDEWRDIASSLPQAPVSKAMVLN